MIVWRIPRQLGKFNFTESLIGFQGRGFAEAVQPRSCHPFLLKELIFQWPKKGIALLRQHWSLRPRNPIRADNVCFLTAALYLVRPTPASSALQRGQYRQALPKEHCCVLPNSEHPEVASLRVPHHAGGSLLTGSGCCSLRLQLDILIGGRVDIPGNQTDAGHGHPGAGDT